MDNPFPPIKRVTVLSLFGDGAETFSTPEEAVEYIESTPDEKKGHLVRFEIQVGLSNGDTVDGIFRDKVRSVDFVVNRRF